MFHVPRSTLHTPQGQGLLEATIAIGIIVVGVLSIFAVGSGQLRAIRVAEERLIAGDLAREGIEIIRSMRDSNWLAGVPWTTGIGDGVAASGILEFSNSMTANPRWRFVTGVSWDTDAAYLYNDGNLYRQAMIPKIPPWTRTPFQRLISIDPTPSDARRVTVEIRWGSVSSPLRVVAETVLQNWK